MWTTKDIYKFQINVNVSVPFADILNPIFGIFLFFKYFTCIAEIIRCPINPPIIKLPTFFDFPEVILISSN